MTNLLPESGQPNSFEFTGRANEVLKQCSTGERMADLPRSEQSAGLVALRYRIDWQLNRFQSERWRPQ
jgi:hypothetical protein